MATRRQAPSTKRPGSAVSPQDATAAELLRRSVQRFVRSFGLLAANATPCGTLLPLSHAHALMFLLAHTDDATPPTQQAMGEALGIDKSNVARLCGKMERQGHITQSRSPTDGRARLLALTTRGLRAAREIDEASRQRFARVLEAVPAGSRDSLLAALEALNGAIAAVGADN
jgi:DNA-binding MarR family transcriptional regulator